MCGFLGRRLGGVGRIEALVRAQQTEEDDGWFDWLLDSDSDDPLAGMLFIVSVESLDDKDVAIRISPQPAEAGDEPPQIEQRDEQAMLALIKGNID